MREIKFRAWDKKKKEWMKEFYVGHNGIVYDFFDNYYPIGNYYPKELTCIPEKDFELNQVIGLTDKNGKEIYEGDILSSPSYGNVEVVWPEKYITGDNEDIMAWCVTGPDYKKLDGVYRGLDVQYTWEIIGNIYENPELLTNPK